MFRLIFDEENLVGYTKYLSKYPINPTEVSKIAYEYLRQYIRPIVSTIHGERFIPVKIVASIRTDLTNELIVPDDGKFYTECPEEYNNAHPLDDAVLLAAKSLVLKCFDCGEDTVKVIPRTIPLPLGACYIDNTFYVYVNVVVDHTLKNESFFKLKDCHYEKLSDLTPNSVLDIELKDSLAIVHNMQSKEVN